MTSLLEEFVSAVRDFTGCGAAGIRILDKEGNIPYQAYKGFSQRFYELESPLSIKLDQCLCINVIKGKTQAKLPYYTKGGSFYTNGTTHLLATLSEKDKGRTRNVCHEFGYESVALVPIRLGDRNLGLIHVADPQENKIPLKVVEVLEEAAMELGTAIRRVRAEEKLRESEERYRALLHLGGEVGEAVIMVQDTEQGEAIQTFVSEQWPRITGYSMDKLLGMSFFDLVSPKDRRASMERHRRKTRGEAIPGLFEMSIIKKDGTEVPIELTSAYTTFQKKRANVAYIREITKRKQMEEALQQSENLYRTIFETTGTATAIVEEDTTFCLVNTEFEKIFGCSKEEIEDKKSWIEFAVKDELDRLREYHRLRRTNPNAAPRHYETRIIDKVGKVKDVLVTADMIPGTKRHIVSVLDITKLKRIEEGLRISESRLRLLSQRAINAQEEERTRIARELHDQLGQELAAIKIEAVSLAEALRNSGKARRAQMLASLVDQHMKTVHRISVNLRPQMLDKLGLVKALQWYAEDFERHTGISCPIEIKDQIIVKSKETATTAYRILQEALTNVLRHAKATQAEIRISKKGNKLVISVSDNGVGMDMSKFDDKSSLGLLGMHERANVIGGSISIRSRHGKGTTVTMQLPL